MFKGQVWEYLEQLRCQCRQCCQNTYTKLLGVMGSLIARKDKTQFDGFEQRSFVNAFIPDNEAMLSCTSIMV